jgi:hypothetical protein
VSNLERRMPLSLEVRRMFEPSRVAAACVAAAYACVVPRRRRRLSAVERARSGTEAGRQRLAGGRVG